MAASFDYLSGVEALRTYLAGVEAQPPNEWEQERFNGKVAAIRAELDRVRALS